MPASEEKEPTDDAVDPPDIVEEADEESFPASDAPAHSVVTGIVDRPIDPEQDR